MKVPEDSQSPAAAVSGPSGHEDCRAAEFARWGRIELEHERRHLSKAMTASAFMKAGEREAIMHELSDIDWFLSQLAVRIDVPPAP